MVRQVLNIIIIIIQHLHLYVTLKGVLLVQNLHHVHG